MKISALSRAAFKRLVPRRVRDRLRPWQEPGRQLRLLYYDRLFRGGIVRRAGFAYRLHANDVIGRYLYSGDHPAKDEIEILNRAGKYFRSFIDVGANIGAVSIPVARSFPGPILALEPVLKNFELLCENIQLNHLSDQVFPTRVAVGDRGGTIDMYLSEENSGDHRAGGCSGDKRKTETVELRTLANCVSQDSRFRPPFLLKLDVQGFEGKVIAGASSLLRFNKCLMLLEFWPDGLMSNGYAPVDMFTLLNGVGLGLYEVTRPLGLRKIACVEGLEKLSERFTGEGFCNLVATNLALAEVGLSDLLRPPAF